MNHDTRNTRGPMRTCSFAIAHPDKIVDGVIVKVRYMSHHTTETSATNVASRWRILLKRVVGNMFESEPHLAEAPEGLRERMVDALLNSWGVFDLETGSWLNLNAPEGDGDE